MNYNRNANTADFAQPMSFASIGKYGNGDGDGDGYGNGNGNGNGDGYGGIL
jgi:hypothetical protein